MTLPADLQINAWAGPDISSHSKIAPDLSTRLLSHQMHEPKMMLAPVAIDPKNWRDPRVGWGIVLADNDTLSDKEKASARDAPEAIQALVAQRSDAPVYRYRSDRRPGTLRRYFVDRDFQDITLAALSYGIGPGEIPRYMLICGAPDIIPWSLQYEMQSSRYTGRLDLTGAALENYINALLNDWNGAAANPKATTVWATDHGSTDITRLMHRAISAPLHKRYSTDADAAFSSAAKFLAAEDATHTNLIDALSGSTPGFIATTSHGATHPLSDVATMKSQLGLLVDQHHELCDLPALLSQWQPNGAIWYAHACCSAGSNSTSSFINYVTQGSDVATILNGVSKCGAMIAPLPRALLGADSPLRAFVGQVEPTFDWTLRHPQTRQFLTIPLLTSFYDRLFIGQPVGMALDECRRASAAVHAAYRIAYDGAINGSDVASEILQLQLMATDWESMVLLGDPTCGIPV